MDASIFSKNFSNKLNKTLDTVLSERPCSAAELATMLGLVAEDSDPNRIAEAAHFCRTAVRVLRPDVLIGKQLGFHTAETPRVSRGRSAEIDPAFVEQVLDVLRKAGAPMAAARIIAALPGADPVADLARLRSMYKAGALPGVEAKKKMGFRLVEESATSTDADTRAA